MAPSKEELRDEISRELESARQASNDATDPDTVARFTQLILELEERFRALDES